MNEERQHVLHFIFVLQLIVLGCMILLWVMGTYPVPMDNMLIVLLTVELFVASLAFEHRVYQMTTKVTSVIGIRKECNPLMQYLLTSHPRIVKVMPNATIILTFLFILTAQILLTPSSSAALYIPIAMTYAIGVDYANDLIVSWMKYRPLFWKE